MPYIDFDKDLPQEKKDYLQDRIIDLSKGDAMGGAEGYEFASRTRAMISRSILSDLELNEQIALRIYGMFGKVLNRSLRFNKHPRLRHLEWSNDIIDTMRGMFDINLPDEISDANVFKRYRMKTLIFGPEDEGGMIGQGIREVIDNVIDKHSPRFSKSGNYLYRIQWSKLDTFNVSDEMGKDVFKKIGPGDIISDKGFWSSATEATSALFRYSKDGQSATHADKIPADEQEILFMIENNENLKAVDISGFKMPKRKEGRTSGEILIKSDSLFKVTGIQRFDPKLERRIVTLEPLDEAIRNPSLTIKDSFDGKIR